MIGGIDFAAVHAKLWPEYVIAASRARYDAASFEAAGAALRAEAGRDANLDALLVELHGILGAGPAAQSERVLYLCWSWNDYLDRQSIPWRIRDRVLWHDWFERIILRRGRFVRQHLCMNVETGELTWHDAKGD